MRGTTTDLSLVADDRPAMERVNLDAAFDSFDERWSPRLAAELNGQAVKLAKLEGEFVWHHRDDADELFLVRKGRLRIEFRDDEDVTLDEGELLVVPAGVERRPVTEEGEAEVLRSSRAGRGIRGPSRARRPRRNRSEFETGTLGEL